MTNTPQDPTSSCSASGETGEPSVLSLQDMIEQSVLDTMGLLEGGERDAFERSFAAAAPEIQAQVRAEQTRLAKMDALLPDVEAPLELRARVLEAVRRAVEDAQSQEAETLETGSPVHRHAGGHRQLRRSRKVAPVWRAAAIASASAAVVLGAAMMHFQQRFVNLEVQQIAKADIEKLVEEAGARWSSLLLLDPLTQRDALMPVPGGDDRYRSVQAMLVSHPDHDTAHFTCQNFSADKNMTYQIVEEMPDGSVRVLSEIEPHGGLFTWSVDVGADGLKTGGRLAVHAVGRIGNELVRAAVLVSA